MFQTYPESEIPIPSILVSNGEKVWRWVEPRFFINYFLVTVVETDGEQTRGRLLMFSSAHEVLKLKSDPSSGFKIERIDIMSPSYVNGTDGYRLDRVQQIWQLPDQSATGFVIADGTVLFDADSVDEQHKLDEMELRLKL